MQIAILTSSRADFGFYKPLLGKLKSHRKIKASVVVFGTHLSKKHGYTLDDIKASGFDIHSTVNVIPSGDTPASISKLIGEAHIKFSKFWSENKFDLIVCLGDRYEMFAAVSSSVPFNIPVAHLSGGEETKGAIDNIYRHALTLMARYHFTNTKKNAARVKQITGKSENIFNTGSMAVDNIFATDLYSDQEFSKIFGFDLKKPFVLFTFHPETINYNKNGVYASELKKLLLSLGTNVIVTMPNADTSNHIIREALTQAASESKSVFLYESLGSRGYYTAMSKCLCIIGNSSSGIVEAASFGKYVLNLGDRQKGRESGKNVIHLPVSRKKILEDFKKISKRSLLGRKNIYGDGKASGRIVKILEKISSKKR
jgi:GDP/UDP-N,N'-diacetylbacillosamine 2-epimerase (hydrolysing)